MRSIYWYRISVINSMTISPICIYIYIGFEIPKDLCSFQTITVHIYTYDLYRYTTHIYIYIYTKTIYSAFVLIPSKKRCSKGTQGSSQQTHSNLPHMFTSTEDSSFPPQTPETFRFVKRKCDKNSSSLKQILSWKVQRLDYPGNNHCPMPQMSMGTLIRTPNYPGQLKNGWFLL